MVNDGMDEDQELDCRLQVGGSSTIRNYLELMRLPNVFTAMADVAMGFLFVQAVDWHWNHWRDSWTLAILIVASSLLYLAGVVLNDVFDLETDRQQRPERPLPSGRLPIQSARRLGWQMLVLGVLVAAGASVFTGQMRPAVVAALLGACILLYDAWLKNTPLGPVAMGACRLLNVFLGLSALDVALLPEHFLAAGGIGVYVAGLTWFARREHRRGNRLQLTLATLIMALGIAMLAWIPSWSQRINPRIVLEPQHWYLLTGVIGGMIIWRCLWAIVEPASVRIRMAVAQCVLSIVMLDAVACYAVRGLFWASMILLFLAPALFLGRWFDTT